MLQKTIRRLQEKWVAARSGCPFPVSPSSVVVIYKKAFSRVFFSALLFASRCGILPTHNRVFHMAALDYRLTAGGFWAFLVWLNIPRRSGQSEPAHFFKAAAFFHFFVRIIRICFRGACFWLLTTSISAAIFQLLGVAGMGVRLEKLSFLLFGRCTGIYY